MIRAECSHFPCSPRAGLAQRALLVLPIFAMAWFAGLNVGSAQANSITTGVSAFGVAAEDSVIASTRIKDAGGSYVLRWARWDQIAPRKKPERWDPTDPADENYNWDYAYGSTDKWVVAARNAGLEPILQVYGAPSWANRCTAEWYMLYPVCNPDPSAMADFLTAAARRYSGSFAGLPRVKFWQIQNEPNLRYFFSPQYDAFGNAISPGIYRELLNTGYRALKSVNPDNFVLAGGLAPNKATESMAPMEFTRDLLCMDRDFRPLPSPNACDGGVKLDAFDMHPYTSGGPTHKAEGSDNVQLGDLPELAQLLEAADLAGHIDGSGVNTPLWITEMGWDSAPPDPGGVPIKILTRWTAEAIFRSWKAGVRNFLWYSLRDGLRGPGEWNQTPQAGLYFRGEVPELDFPKPSLAAFRFPFVAFSTKKGVNLWGRTPTSERGAVVIQVRTKSGWKRLTILRTNENGLFSGHVKSRKLSRKVGSVRAVFWKVKSPPFSLKPVEDFSASTWG